jgi:hypothetical protein
VVTAQSASSVTVSTVNLAGVATDFAVNLVVFGGGNIV